PNNGPSANRLDSVSCVAATSCTAVGSFLTSNGTQTLIESWNGAAWSIVPSPNKSPDDYLQSVSCASLTSCTAVGAYLTGSQPEQTLVESWNGTTWSIDHSPNRGTDSNILRGASCTPPSSCMAVGMSVK